MSFLDKLKKNMGVFEETPEEVVEEPLKRKQIEPKIPQKTTDPGPAKLEIKKKPINSEVEEKEEIAEKTEIKKEKWFEPEGQLAIDMYQTETDLIIQSAIAGVSPESLDITMERDVITIRGIRAKPFEEEGDYFIQECYWGAFSREVILPVEVDPDRAEASMKEGILTIRLPKILREKRRRIKIRG